MLTTPAKIQKMFYFRVIYDPIIDNDPFDGRNLINNVLNKFGYKWFDCCGGQAAFEPKGDFIQFVSIIRGLANQYNIPVERIEHCNYPGLGLFH